MPKSNRDNLTEVYVVIITYINWSKDKREAQRVFSGRNSRIVEKKANKWVEDSTHCQVLDDDRFWTGETELNTILKRSRSNN